MIIARRIYGKSEEKGYRVLVDRLWPRGVPKGKVDLWIKDIAPSASLRKWFNHDPEKWEGFISRYRDEITRKKDLVQKIKGLEKGKRLILLYGAKDELHNNAIALKKIIS